MNSRYATIKATLDERPYLKERTLRRYLAEGRIAHTKLGGTVLVDLLSLDAELDKHRVEAV